MVGRVVVLGDVFLDRYLFGVVGRLNPECFGPLVDVVGEEFRLGGAGNVAVNVGALGGVPFLVGVVGDDFYGGVVRGLLDEVGVDYCLLDSGKGSIVKSRVLAGGQQLLRFDVEDRGLVSGVVCDGLCDVLEREVGVGDVLVVSDYAKGTLGGKVLDCVGGLGVRVLVDPKPENEGLYPSSYLIKPNLKEYSEMSVGVGKYENVLVTKGADGMVLYNGKGCFEFPAVRRDVFDVCGAGDSVISTIATFLSEGKSLEECVRLGNKAGGLVVGKVGTSYVTREELLYG